MIGKLATEGLKKNNLERERERERESARARVCVCVCVCVCARAPAQDKRQDYNSTLFCVDSLAQPFQFLLRAA